jgi:hypothetical protein
MSEADLDYARLRDYLAGQMPDNECRTFEDRLQRDPALARELDLSLRLSAGLGSLSAQDRRSVSGSSKTLSWTKRFAAAAATLACIALFLWARPTTISAILTNHEAPLIEARPSAARPSEARPIVAHFSFIATRGLSVPDLELPPNGLIEIRSAPSRRGPSLRYAVTLVAREPSGDRTLAVLHDLSADADGYVRCYADAQRLRPGTYELLIETVSGTAAKDAFTFNLHAEPHVSP